jgi:hypothetical protein
VVIEFINEAKPIDDHPRPIPVDITAHMPIDFIVIIIQHAVC